MALYHKWDVKNGFAYVLQFFPLIFDGLGGVQMANIKTEGWSCAIPATFCH
jgi:hypothetical protein